MSIPCIVIAGIYSGCGKTTVSSGIMSALNDRGMTVQPFKVGPDFIDPTHHTAICGRTSRNLDPYMMGEEGVIDTFAAASKGADIAVIEGVMGMYDGLDGGDTGSTAHIARLLDAPVILVVDVKGMSRSVNAMIKGYTEFDPEVNIAGVIFNRVGSDRHRRLIETSLTARPLGWIPKKPGLEVKSRHLGLKMASEESIAEAGRVMAEHCDLNSIIALARSNPCPAMTGITDDHSHSAGVKIGIAMDGAFCFYYTDNFERLRKAGALIEFFSPISDRLPDVDAVYLGGGYPELHAPELSASPCRQDLMKAIDDGIPVYAECGGLMYLAESITTDSDHRMCGALPCRAIMTGRIQGLGYVNAYCTGGSFLEQGLMFRGHEFHYSRVEPGSDARYSLKLSRGKGIDGSRDGMYVHNALGAYTHAYFTEQAASSLVAAAGRYRRS